MNDVIFYLYGNFLFRKDTDDNGIQDNLYAQFCGFCQKFFPDVESANLCLVFLGAEKLMDLFEQLSAGLGIFVVNDNVHSLFRGFNGCGQSCRTCTDDDHIITLHHFAAPPGCSAVTPYCV